MHCNDRVASRANICAGSALLARSRGAMTADNATHGNPGGAGVPSVPYQVKGYSKSYVASLDRAGAAAAALL
ncbi:exported hypothetical protein [Burkholderiales bacterium]|nr:exported hypothetical protein [Burkholderiales bacterium]